MKKIINQSIDRLVLSTKLHMPGQHKDIHNSVVDVIMVTLLDQTLSPFRFRTLEKKVFFFQTSLVSVQSNRLSAEVGQSPCHE